MKIKKIFLIVFLIILVMLMLSSKLYAFSVSEWFSQAETAINDGKSNSNNKLNSSEIKNTSNTLYNILLGIGTGVAVIVGAILGVQFMQAGIDKKVQVKEALVAYVISCIVLFGAFGIWKLIVTIMSSIS